MLSNLYYIGNYAEVKQENKDTMKQAAAAAAAAVGIGLVTSFTNPAQALSGHET